MRRLLPAALMIFFAATAQAEPCTADPTTFARSFFEAHRDFYADYSLAGPEVVTEGLRALLLKEFECAAQEGPCNLEAGACWQVADLITPAGESLAALLARPMPE